MKTIGSVNALYPTPTTIVGATVNGKPNFITIAHIGLLTLNIISLGMAKVHYTNAGIKENKTFSVCIPSEDLMVEADYCGIMTGRSTDKASLFNIFYGELESAPMIRECAVCMECSLEQVVEFPSHDVFIGEIKQTYADESVITEGKIDITKLKPILFDMNSKKYWGLGRELGKCWSVGKQLKEK